MSEKIPEKESRLNTLLTPREKKLILMLREINYGELIVAIKDRQPVRVEEVKRSIKL